MRRHVIMVLTAAIILTGCSKASSLVGEAVTNSPVVAESMAGYEFLHQLHTEGRLPGDFTNEHGTVSLVHTASVSDLKSLTRVTYPFLQTFDIAPESQTFTNHYTVVQPTKDAAWELQHAWRTVADGTIEEWPVK